MAKSCVAFGIAGVRFTRAWSGSSAERAADQDEVVFQRIVSHFSAIDFNSLICSPNFLRKYFRFSGAPPTK
jgi:hypothetical protein